MTPIEELIMRFSWAVRRIHSARYSILEEKIIRDAAKDALLDLMHLRYRRVQHLVAMLPAQKRATAMVEE